MGLELSKYIDRSPEEVFRFYAVNHVVNHPRWDPDMHLEQVGEGPIGVGTVIRRRHTHYGEPVEGTMEIVKYEADRAFGVVIHDGAIEIRSETSIEPEGEGSRMTIGVEIPGSKDPINPSLVERTLNNIKMMVESEIPKGP